jgi:hypothetical protein
LELFYIFQQNFLGHLIRVDHEDVVSGAQTLMVVSVVAEISTEFPLVHRAPVFVLLEHVTDGIRDPPGVDEDVDVVLRFLHFREKKEEVVEFSVFIAHADGIGDPSHFLKYVVFS